MGINSIMISIFIKVSIVSVCILLLKLTLLVLHKKLSAERIYYLLVTIVIFSLLPIDALFSDHIFEISSVSNGFDRVYILDVPTRESIEVVNRSNLSHISIINTLFVIWLIGSIIALAYMLIKYLMFLKQIKKWKIIKDSSEIMNMINEEKIKLNIRSEINIYACSGVNSPMVFGILKPIILLPLDGSSTDQLIIRHELIHLKRRDSIIKLITQITTAVYWFNPLIYLLRNTLDTYCEISCDEKVLLNQSMSVRKQYFDMLLNTVIKNNVSSSLFVSQFANVSKTKLRLFEILNEREKSNRRIASVMLIFFMLSLSMLIGCKADREFNGNQTSNNLEANSYSNNSANNEGENSSSVENQEEVFDPSINDTYDKPIIVVYDSFEDIRPIIEQDLEVVFTKEVDGFVYKGPMKMKRASKIEESRKWEAVFIGSLDKQ